MTSNRPGSKEENPHRYYLEFLDDRTAAAVQIILGLCLPLVILLFGLQDLFSDALEVPIPHRGQGILWAHMTGLGVIATAFVEIGIATLLHVYFFIRLHDRWWVGYDAAITSAAAITVISLVTTLIYASIDLL